MSSFGGRTILSGWSLLAPLHSCPLLSGSRSSCCGLRDYCQVCTPLPEEGLVSPFANVSLATGALANETGVEATWATAAQAPKACLWPTASSLGREIRGTPDTDVLSPGSWAKATQTESQPACHKHVT